MTTSENFIYNVYGDKQNEPQITTKIQSLSKDDYDIYFCELGKGVYYYELLLENQMIDSNKFFSQSD